MRRGHQSGAEQGKPDARRRMKKDSLADHRGLWKFRSADIAEIRLHRTMF
jgi:hypothetical protein